MCGFKDFQDYRLQPPPEPAVNTCCDCAYYRDVTDWQDGAEVCIGVCFVRVLLAEPDDLMMADLDAVHPDDLACERFGA